MLHHDPGLRPPRPAGSASRLKDLLIEPHLMALADTSPSCYWLDRPERPAPQPALERLEETDLVIVGGGFTGLWAALQAKEADPSRDVVLLEARSIAEGAGIELRRASGRVYARKAVLATNAFRSPLPRMRRASIPVWDYALVTEPLSETQLGSIARRNRQSLTDGGNQFHDYRLTRDNRILWGGYDAIYHYGSRTDDRFQQRPESFAGLSKRFLDTFPRLEGLRFSHQWGGPISTTTRSYLEVGTAHGRRVSWAIGYTGQGVVASRFGARLALDLIDRPNAPHLELDLVRKRAFPWPPEPLRSMGVRLTQRALARADANEGRRGLWLRTLDFLGLGFDS